MAYLLTVCLSEATAEESHKEQNKLSVILRAGIFGNNASCSAFRRQTVPLKVQEYRRLQKQRLACIVIYVYCLRNIYTCGRGVFNIGSTKSGTRHGKILCRVFLAVLMFHFPRKFPIDFFLSLR